MLESEKRALQHEDEAEQRTIIAKKTKLLLKKTMKSRISITKETSGLSILESTFMKKALETKNGNLDLIPEKKNNEIQDENEIIEQQIKVNVDIKDDNSLQEDKKSKENNTRYLNQIITEKPTKIESYKTNNSTFMKIPQEGLISPKTDRSDDIGLNTRSDRVLNTPVFNKPAKITGNKNTKVKDSQKNLNFGNSEENQDRVSNLENMVEFLENEVNFLRYSQQKKEDYYEKKISSFEKEMNFK